jgi:hypothetical protein
LPFVASASLQEFPIARVTPGFTNANRLHKTQRAPTTKTSNRSQVSDFDGTNDETGCADRTNFEESRSVPTTKLDPAIGFKSASGKLLRQPLPEDVIGCHRMLFRSTVRLKAWGTPLDYSLEKLCCFR